jgi:WD repeat-containing protein 23
MSAGWESHGGGSSIARHEWKGLLKRKGDGVRRGELETFVERRRANSARAERYRMPGRLSGYVDDDDDDSDYVPENL